MMMMKPIRLHLEVLKFEDKKICCLNIDRTTIRGLQMERCEHFLLCVAKLRPRFVSTV